MEGTDYQIMLQYREKARFHFKDAIEHLNEDSKYKSEISLAQKEIDNAIHVFEEFNTEDNPLMLIIGGIADIDKLYGLAAEIYSHIDIKKSINYYKLFQYYTFRRLFITELDTRNEKFDYNDKRDEGVIAYKFRSCSSYCFDDLAKKKITLSKPNCMNDPFDSLYNIWSRPDNLSNFVKDIKSIPMFHKSFDYYRFCSFCIDDDAENSILRNILMWSHYADEHKGICIRYRLYDDCVSSKLSLDVHHQTALHRIHYNMDDKQISVKDKSITIGLALTHKASCWDYEKESRLICYDDTTEKDHLKILYKKGISIESVYFGINCSDDNKAIIKRLLGDKKVDYYNMKCNYEDVYKMDIDPEI